MTAPTVRAMTKGAMLRNRLDAPAIVSAELRASGMLPTISAAQIERMADEEFERRTWNGWSRLVCPTCQQATSHNGACGCQDGRDSAGMARLSEDSLLAMLGVTRKA